MVDEIKTKLLKVWLEQLVTEAKICGYVAGSFRDVRPSLIKIEQLQKDIIELFESVSK